VVTTSIYATVPIGGFPPQPSYFQSALQANGSPKPKSKWPKDIKELLQLYKAKRYPLLVLQRNQLHRWHPHHDRPLLNIDFPSKKCSYEAGVPMHAIADLLGHSSMDVTAIYARVVDHRKYTPEDVLSRTIREALIRSQTALAY